MLYHWLEMITEILSCLQIFSMRKATSLLFKIFKNLQENRQKNHIPGICWAFKSKLQITLAATYSSNNFFYMYVITHSYLFLLFSHFLFLFSPSLSYSSN